MLEVELKSVVADIADTQRRLEQLGARVVFVGRLEDRRYDTADGALTAREHVLRLRVYRGTHGARAELDWKGPASYDSGYKIREELGTLIGDPDALDTMLHRLGLDVTMAIDREISQYEVEGAVVRLERYPRMDDLIEVEGPRESIERAISALGMPRSGFTNERLPEFIARFERRTGTRAALCDAELVGTARYDARNA